MAEFMTPSMGESSENTCSQAHFTYHVDSKHFTMSSKSWVSNQPALKLLFYWAFVIEISTTSLYKDIPLFKQICSS